MDQEVALSELGEDGPPGCDRRPAAVRRIVELRQGEARDLPQRPEVEQSVRLVQVPRAQGAGRGGVFEQELPQQQVPHRLGHRLLHLDAHDGPVGPALRLFLDHLQEARGVVLVELQVRPPRHAECVGGLDAPSWIQQTEIFADDLLQRDEAGAARHRHEARQGVRYLQIGEVRRPAVGVAHHRSEREPQVGDEGERVTGRACEGLRRDERKDLVGEVAAQRLLLRLRQLAPPQQANAVRGERRQALVAQTASLALQQRARPHGDRVELLLRRQPVLAGVGDAAGHGPLQRRDAHHEELVQVCTQDGEEPHPSKQRHVGVFRQCQHATVELDQAQVAVEEVLGHRGTGGGERRAQGDVGEPRAPLAGAGRRRLARLERRVPGPLGEGVGARRHGERRQRARIAQARRAGAGQQLVEGEPLELPTRVRVPRAGDAAGQPHFEHRSGARRRGSAEEAHLPVRAPEMRA